MLLQSSSWLLEQLEVSRAYPRESTSFEPWLADLVESAIEAHLLPQLKTRHSTIVVVSREQSPNKAPRSPLKQDPARTTELSLKLAQHERPNGQARYIQHPSRAAEASSANFKVRSNRQDSLSCCSQGWHPAWNFRRTLVVPKRPCLLNDIPEMRNIAYPVSQHSVPPSMPDVSF